MVYSNSIDANCAVYDSLSETEKRIADFIIQNTDHVTHMSVREIADKSNTSGATVSRFVRHIGYDSFSDLRLAIATDQLSSSVFDDADISEVSLANIEVSTNYVLDHKLQEITGTATHLDPKRIKKAVDLIMSSDNMLFAAVGNSIPVCSAFAFRLGQIGYRTNVPATTESMILGSLSLRRNDLLIVVSSSGYSHRLETIVDNAEDSATPIIFITSNPNAILAQRATVVFTAITRDHLLTGAQFSSHIAEEFILELIFMFILSAEKSVREHAKIELKSLGRDKEFRPTLN